MIEIHVASTDKSDGGSLLLPIQPQLINIPSRVADFARANEFTQKEEFHVTAIGKRWTPLIPENLQKSVDMLVESVDWKIDLNDRYFVLSKHGDNNEEKLSIVQLVEVPALNQFIFNLSKLIQQDLGKPYPHITIFTKGSNGGIGIYSEDEFKNHFVKEIT
ncbi:MAG: hypothetical protein JWO54_819 [Candidatus Saccharibacteria bacterium]|nr:hypothetical protein [Candidatus Saccharibacteria bacterium]